MTDTEENSHNTRLIIAKVFLALISILTLIALCGIMGDKKLINHALLIIGFLVVLLIVPLSLIWVNLSHRHDRFTVLNDFATA